MRDVSVDEGTGSLAPDDAGYAGSSPATGPGATKRRKLLDEEHRLLDERREHLEKARERLDAELRGLVDQEHRVAELVKASTPG